jgi:hypothetical protein
MHSFDRDMALDAGGQLDMRGTVSDNWSVNGTPNGGYIMALLATAMMANSDRRSTPIVTANYINRCVPGSAEIGVEKISNSSQFNRLQARLVQEGKERVRAIGTFSDEKMECVLNRYEAEEPALVPPDACVAIPVMPQYTLMQNLDIRLEPACAGWMQGKLAERSEQRGWLRFRNPRSYDLASLFLVADAFPPPVFVSQGLAAWVPTIELTVNVRSVPRTEWLKCVFRTRFITCGLLEEDGEVWDGNGTLVAITRQIAQYRNPAQ